MGRFVPEWFFCAKWSIQILIHLKTTAADAAAIIALGSCAAWGGIASAGLNPTGARGVIATLQELNIDKPVINIPGCPPNPHNFLSTVVHYLMYGVPALDKENRPRFAYGTLIHDQCERRAHFDSGRFAEAFGDEGHRKGYCLYKLGCKGPSTYGNCPEQGFNARKKWPVSIGHPCFGCIESKVGFTRPLFEVSEMVTAAIRRRSIRRPHCRRSGRSVRWPPGWPGWSSVPWPPRPWARPLI